MKYFLISSVISFFLWIIFLIISGALATFISFICLIGLFLYLAHEEIFAYVNNRFGWKERRVSQTRAVYLILLTLFTLLTSTFSLTPTSKNMRREPDIVETQKKGNEILLRELLESAKQSYKISDYEGACVFLEKAMLLQNVQDKSKVEELLKKCEAMIEKREQEKNEFSLNKDEEKRLKLYGKVEFYPSNEIHEKVEITPKTVKDYRETIAPFMKTIFSLEKAAKYSIEKYKKRFTAYTNGKSTTEEVYKEAVKARRYCQRAKKGYEELIIPKKMNQEGYYVLEDIKGAMFENYNLRFQAFDNLVRFFNERDEKYLHKFPKKLKLADKFYEKAKHIMKAIGY